MKGNRTRAIARAIYHRLPLSQSVKWRLRARLSPLIVALTRSPTIGTVSRGIADSIVGGTPDAVVRDFECEAALSAILRLIGEHAARCGPADHWLALPFLSSGGAERVALNICRALREVRPTHACVLFLTDRKVVNPGMAIPEGTLVVAFDDYLGEGASYARKQSLLRDLLLAVQPQCFHNINSEVAWHLILAEGERLKKRVPLFASIFAFQFAPDKVTKIGYAAYFLKQGLPHLTGLLSDNRRFIDDAALEYGLNDEERSKLRVLYQPCRLEAAPPAQGVPFNKADRRLQVIWAGRLDEEKRVDLFIEIVRRCTFADFKVFGQVVLGDGAKLPSLPNLSYEGAFSSPLDWIERHSFDAFLFTSKWEGLPNILIEAGWLGIPIIAPTVGGVGELVATTTGFPLPEDPTVDDYERALRLIEGNQQDAMARAARMRLLVSERHSWPAFAAAVTEVPGYVGSAEPAPPRDLSNPQAVAVSVVVPCFNQGRYLRESVGSVCAATRASVEVIVVDDGSSDPRTERYLKELEQAFPAIVRIVRQANKGLSGARNAGLELARGEFIQFLDADDLLAPGKIDAQLAQFAANPKIDVSVCNFLLCDESVSEFSKPEEAIARFDLELADFLYRWERGFAVPIHCGLFRRAALPAAGFDVHARAKEDWIFWTGLAMAGVRFGYVHGHWAIYRQHASSMRRSYMGMGRAWLQAGLKIEAALGGREPLFFESVVAWFEQCYRSSPAYRQEIAELHSAGGSSVREVAAKDVSVGDDVAETVRSIVDALRSSPVGRGAQKPLLSVVVPVYGHYEYLSACLRSLADQGDVSFEIVCVDDCSPDPRVTALMAGLTGQLPGLKIMVLPSNQGISLAQNLAVEAARGDFVAFLDCDDELEPGALSVIGGKIAAHPEVDYFFSDRRDVNESGVQVRVASYGGYGSISFRSQACIKDDLLDGMVASHLKVIRRDAYLAVGGCDPLFSGVQDWDLALRLAERSTLHYVDQVLYRHRVHLNSVTRGDLVAQFRKTNCLRRRFGERWLMPRGVQPDAPQAFVVFDAKRLPLPLETLKQSWREGKRCAVDLSGPINISTVNFVREFNSYFESVVWDDPAVPAALVGYVWDPAILVRDTSI